jgi:hypothetical protein
MKRSTWPTTAALLSAVAVIACSNVDAPSAEVAVSVSTADVAASAADQVASDVALLLGSEGAASLAAQRATTVAPGVALSVAAQAANCAYSAATQSYTCASASEGGLTVTRSFTLFDAAGATQAQYDAATTAEIEYQLAAQGTFARTGYSASYSRAATLAASGLAGAETQRTWSGAGSSTLHADFERADGARAYDFVSSDTVSNVVFRLPTASHPFPESGRIVHRMTVKQTMDGGVTVSRTVSRRVVVTFNGTDAVALRVGSVDCSLYLSTKTVTCAGQQSASAP